MIAQHLFWLHFLGLRDPDTDRQLANELLARRRDDGTWSIWFDGPRRPLDLDRGVRRAEDGGRRSGPGEPRLHPASRRDPGQPRLHEVFPRALGHWPWQRIPTVPVEIMLLRPRRPVLGLQLRLLGEADGRAALGRPGVSAGAACGRRCSARSAPAPARRGRARRLGRPPPGYRGGRSVGARAPGGGRLWGGIQPPWVWSIVMLASLGHGFEDQRSARGRGLERLHGRRGRPPSARSLPVAGLGYRARGARAARRGRAGRPSAAREGAASGCSARR